ncbi:hypothetical protein RF11_04282 [Thelohanellus kitauei]|uniref:Vacuolar protein sorting/targeting protein 10 n=1 Tax=Thelohanellus kitauei TaxID=669202 RepID=A0A0C2I5E1_THEKT|nr:hypothetical protein RF11_04282 [Thelohanellus kitauei]
MWHHENDEGISTKIFYQNILGKKADMSNYTNFKKYFYLHGNLYTLGWKKESTLCLWRINQFDQSYEISCKIPLNYGMEDKCPFVVNPYLPGFLYANLINNDFTTLTYMSDDDGKYFFKTAFMNKCTECGSCDCEIEFDLPCEYDLIKNTFPEKYIIKLEGTFHKNAVPNRRTSVTFDAGDMEMILHSTMQNLVVLNRGAIIFATEKQYNKIWYSLDDGLMWNSKSLVWDNFTKLIPIEYSNSPVIAAINYDKLENIYSIYSFNFSNVIGNYSSYEKDELARMMILNISK